MFVPLTTIVELPCGCSVELWKILILLAKAVERGEDLLCPAHMSVLRTDSAWKEYAKNFLDYLYSEEGQNLHPVFKAHLKNVEH